MLAKQSTSYRGDVFPCVVDAISARNSGTSFLALQILKTVLGTFFSIMGISLELPEKISSRLEVWQSQKVSRA